MAAAENSYYPLPLKIIFGCSHRMVINIDKKKALQISNTVGLMFEAEKLTPSEVAQICETVKLGMFTAAIETEMKRKYGLIEVER